MTVNLDGVKKFARESIERQTRRTYKFRSRFRHTLRVLRWVEVLQDELGGDLEVLRIAALLHDVGWKESVDHDIVSWEISKKYLETLDLSIDKKEKILESVLYHTRKESKGLCLEAYILMDADDLDEVGATSIVWDSMAAGLKDNSSFYTAYERIKKFSGTLNLNLDELNFEKTKEIYKSRLAIIDSFINELEYELDIKNK